MDQVLSIRLAAHGGVVAARDLHDAGVSEQTVRTAVRRGELIRVNRGAYVDGRRYREAQPDERYRLRVAAVYGPGQKTPPATTQRWPSSGCLWSGVTSDDSTPWERSRQQSCDGVWWCTRASRVRPRWLTACPPCRLPTPSPQATGTSGLKTGLVAADAALHLGLHEAVARVSTPMSSTALAKLVDLVEPLAESPGESLTRMVLRTAGLPVRSQVRISDGHGRLARVDFLVGDKVVVEFDGQVKYTGAGGDELFREKRREDLAT